MVLSSSHGRTSWPASVLRGGNTAPAGITPCGLLAFEPLAPDLVPAGLVAAAVLLDVVGLGLQRRMHRTVGEVEEEGLGRMRRPHLSDHLQRLIGEVVGEVVVVGIGVDVERVVVLVEAVGLMEVGEAVEDAVVALEALLQRPGVPGPGLAQVGVLAEVPLAHHERRPAVVTEQLRHGHGVLSDLHRVAREAGIEVRDVADAGHVVVQPGEHRGPRRRAHRVDVEVDVADTIGGELVDVGRVDLGAVAADIGEAEVVDEHDDDVRSPVRGGRRPRPRRLRRREDPSDGALEPGIGLVGFAHDCWLPRV